MSERVREKKQTKQRRYMLAKTKKGEKKSKSGSCASLLLVFSV
jgi:hypothetical protein